jgi:uncharacterized protein (DUF2267 family)
MEATMSATGLEVLDKSIQTTNIWLNEISEQIGPDRHLAWHVLGVVLRALRDRLPVDDAAHFAAQLPLVVRGTFYEQYRPSIQPEDIRTREEFVAKVAKDLTTVRPVDPVDAIRAVFATVQAHIPEGQTAKTRASLTEDIRKLWPTESPVKASPPNGSAAKASEKRPSSRT